MNRIKVIHYLNKKINKDISKKLLKLNINSNKTYNEKTVYFIRNARSYNDLVYNPNENVHLIQF